VFVCDSPALGTIVSPKHYDEGCLMPPALLSAAQNPYLPVTAMGRQNCGAGFSCTQWTRFTPTPLLVH